MNDLLTSFLSWGPFPVFRFRQPSEATPGGGYPSFRHRFPVLTYHVFWTQSCPDDVTNLCFFHPTNPLPYFSTYLVRHPLLSRPFVNMQCLWLEPLSVFSLLSIRAVLAQLQSCVCVRRTLVLCSCLGLNPPTLALPH